MNPNRSRAYKQMGNATSAGLAVGVAIGSLVVFSLLYLFVMYYYSQNAGDIYAKFNTSIDTDSVRKKVKQKLRELKKETYEQEFFKDLGF